MIWEIRHLLLPIHYMTKIMLNQHKSSKKPTSLLVFDVKGCGHNGQMWKKYCEYGIQQTILCISIKTLLDLSLGEGMNPIEPIKGQGHVQIWICMESFALHCPYLANLRLSWYTKAPFTCADLLAEVNFAYLQNLHLCKDICYMFTCF